jgi:hypothetical protein
MASSVNLLNQGLEPKIPHFEVSPGDSFADNHTLFVAN